MLKAMRDHEPLSQRALNVAIFSLGLAIILGLLDGYLRGYLKYSAADQHAISIQLMLGEWCYDLRNVAENVIWAAAVVFIGAKLLEGRTILSVGFDKLDAAKVSVKGPDEDNIVWIGHRYGTRFEAETVAATLESRLREDTET
jgi:hypothetical protein